MGPSVLLLTIFITNACKFPHVPYSHWFQNTALHYACAGGHVKAVELLLEKKANVKLLNAYHQTPLDQAIDNHHNSVVVVMLRKKGSDCFYHLTRR